MVFLLSLLTAVYAAVVVWFWREKRQVRTVAATLPETLPVEDLPPAGAVGWPPGGTAFTSYVTDGLAAIDAFLGEDHAA